MPNLRKKRKQRPLPRLTRAKAAKSSGNREAFEATKRSSQLTDTEAGLLSKMEGGYQLENNPLGGGLLLRRLKDNEVLRPASANLNTVKALEERGLIRPVKSRDPLTTLWQVSNRTRRK
jgi:hypothetical protein